MTRILPRSLKGQLILLVLIGLLLSQAAGFVFIVNDQTSRMKSEWLHNIFTRIATVRDVIESTPGEVHGKILKTASSWALKFAIDRSPCRGTRKRHSLKPFSRNSAGFSATAPARSI